MSNDPVTITFKQPIKATDPLRTGTYSKTLTFTLSTTTSIVVALGSCSAGRSRFRPTRRIASARGRDDHVPALRVHFLQPLRCEAKGSDVRARGAALLGLQRRG